MEFTAAQIATIIGGQVIGDPQRTVTRISKIEEATEGSLAFIANPKYEHFLTQTGASIILVQTKLKTPANLNATLIKIEDPYAAFAKLLEVYQKLISPAPEAGIEQPCFIDESAQVSESVYIGAFAYVGKNVKIGKGSRIFPQVYLGNQVTIGENTIIYPGVKIYDHCVVGDHVIIHAGSVIGADGFGFAPQGNGDFKKVPQLGRVVIENDVEIGANTCIDRATIGDTRIGRNVKLDNLIQIAHNVRIGGNTAIAAQAGISGSTQIGNNCIIGGQAGLVGHIRLADHTRVNAQSGVSKTVAKTGIDLTGTPAFAYRDALKSQVIFKKLPELLERIENLEKQIKSNL